MVKTLHQMSKLKSPAAESPVVSMFTLRPVNGFKMSSGPARSHQIKASDSQ